MTKSLINKSFLAFLGLRQIGDVNLHHQLPVNLDATLPLIFCRHSNLINSLCVNKIKGVKKYFKKKLNKGKFPLKSKNIYSFL